MIKVSVIVPIYKVPLEFLKDCFDSLLAQTMLDCEFIIISDGSTETECALCEEFSKRNSRFKFFRCKHVGVSATRNYGIRQAKGEYITFVDADDIIPNDSLDSLYLIAKKNNSDIAFGDVDTFKEDSTTFDNIQQWRSHDINFLTATEREEIKKNFIFNKNFNIIRGACAKLYKKGFLDSSNILFNPNISICEDAIFNYKLFSLTSNLVYKHQIVYFYRQHHNSSTHIFKENCFYEFVKYIEEIKKFSGNEHPKVLGRAAFEVFLDSYRKEYLSPANQKTYFQKIRELKKIIFSNQFHSLLSDIDLNEKDLYIKTQCFFLCHKITIWIRLHLLYHTIKKHFNQFSKYFFISSKSK